MDYLTLAALWFLLLGCTLADKRLNEVLFSGDYEFIDLTYPFDNQTIYWLGSEEFKFTKKTAMFQRDGSW